jgi:glucosylceramidase
MAGAACLPRSTAPPAIIGLPEVGQTLTGYPGIWIGPPTTITYTWLSCEADAPNDPDACVTRQHGLENTYTVAPADAGRRLRLEVTGTNDEGTATATSAPTPIVRDRTGPSVAWHGRATSPDGPRSQRELAPAAEPSTAALTVDQSARHQEWLGTGAALTDSSVTMLRQASPDLAGALFDPDDPTGARLDLVRLPLSATDFSPRGWTWQDDPGGPFGPPPEQQDALAMLHDLLDVNPEIEVLGAAWSAPAWMKSSGQLNGGALAAGQEARYGDFLVAQAAWLKAVGVPLRSISLGNEPGHSTSSYPTMTMSDAQMITMARAIHPRLELLGVELWALDHNWSDRPRLDNLLAGAPGSFDAAAFHCYSGQPASMGGVPIPVIMTECTGGDWDPSWPSTFRWQARNLVVDPVVNGSTGLTLWNLALDPARGPHLGGCGNCRGVVTVDPATGAWTPEPEFFLLAHLSRAASRGATRIGLAGRPDIPAVAFANPDGTIGIFGHNDSGTRQVVSVTFPAGDAIRVVVEPGDLFSLRGSPLEGAAP